MEETLQGLLRIISPKYLGVMVDNGWLLIESMFYAIRRPPTEYYEKMDPEEAHRVERVRALGEKFGLPLLGMLRYVASHFPYEAVEEKVTPEWMRRRGRDKFPELIKVIEKKGGAGDKWLSSQCREIVQFSTGRLVWSDAKETMVKARPGVAI